LNETDDIALGEPEFFHWSDGPLLADDGHSSRSSRRATPSSPPQTRPSGKDGISWGYCGDTSATM
jgi:hypothetical protein